MSFFAEPFFNNKFFKAVFFHPEFNRFFGEPFFDDIATTFPTNAIGDSATNDVSITYNKIITGVLRPEDFEVKINGIASTVNTVAGVGGTILTMRTTTAFLGEDVLTVQVVPHDDNNLGELPHSEVIHV